jgi:hypothetical protein
VTIMRGPVNDDKEQASMDASSTTMQMNRDALFIPSPLTTCDSQLAGDCHIIT